MSVLLIGLDGTPWSILHKWMGQGELPTFKKIYQNSAHGTLQSTIPTYTCPALPTLFSGKSQGKTGIFGFTYADGTPVSLRTMRDAKIWDILSENDKASCIVNVRMLYPVEPLNGIMISGNPAPSEDSDYVYPPELKARVSGFRHEEINDLSEALTVKPAENKEAILDYRIKMTTSRYQTFKDLVAEKKYDFSFFWVGGTDFMGHWYWDDPETYLRYFKEIDRMLADVLTTFKDHNIIIISDHGMQGVQTRKFFVNTWLEKVGYLKYQGNILTQALKRKLAPQLSLFLSAESKKRLLEILGKKDTVAAASTISEDGQKEIFEKQAYSSVYGLDWPNTKAYLMCDWGVKIQDSLPESERQEIREDIIGQMRQLKDKDGTQIVQKVWKKEDIFNGPYQDQLPDIIFILTEKYGMGTIPSSNITGRINKDQYEPSEGRFFRGDHEGAIDGILMAYGPDMQVGKEVRGAALMDIMPTILHIMDTDLPDDLDGHVLKDIFKPESPLASKDVVTRHYDISKKEAVSLTPEENEAIIKRLEQMGYM